MLLGCAPDGARAQDLILINWRNLSVTDAARLTAQATNSTIRVPPEINASISMASADPITAEQVFSLFQAALHERGLDITSTGPRAFLVRVGTAKGRPGAAPAPALALGPSGIGSPSTSAPAPAVGAAAQDATLAAAQPSQPSAQPAPASPPAIATPTPAPIPAPPPASAAPLPTPDQKAAPTPIPNPLTPSTPVPAPSSPPGPVGGAAPIPAPDPKLAPLPIPVAPLSPAPTPVPAPAPAPRSAPAGPSVALATAPGASASAAPGLRQEVLAIFSTPQRAKGIADKLNQNGGDAAVVPSPDPSDPSYSVVMRFVDTPEGYRKATLAIESANLSGLVSLPAPR